MALLALAALSLPAVAAEWFVSPTGDDARGNGSEARPFRSIMRVINTSTGVARRGDTITLRGPAGNNTYPECDVRLRVPLTLRSYPGERAHIQCPIRTKDSVVVQIDPGASGSRLSNLEISGGQYYGVMMQTDWYQGGPDSDTGASDIVLEDLLIHHTGRDGIKITPRSRRITIRRSEIHNTGQAYPPGTPHDRKNADGIDNVNGDGMVVEDSYIHDIATTGLYFKGGATDVVIQRNRIENTGDAGILAGFDTSPEFFDLVANPGYYESVRGIIRNNVVRNTGYAGIGLFAAKDALVVNNTIVNAARKGHAAIYFGLTFQDWDESAGRPASVNPRIVNNLVMQNNGRCVDIRWSHELGGMSALDGAAGLDWNGYGNSSGLCRFNDQRPASAPGLSTSLAGWQRASHGDANSIDARFDLDADGRPVAGSPALGAGTPLPEVTDDIQRHTRAPPYDLGAFQSNGEPAAVDAAAPQPSVAPRDEQVPMLGTTPDNVSLFVKLVPDPMTLLPWILLAVAVVVLLIGLAVALHLVRKRNVMGWLMGYLRGGWKAPVPQGTTRHLMFCFVDHYEPAWGKPDYAKECERVARWRRDLPTLCAPHRDADGRPPVHSFFYPEEEYRPEHLDSLVDLCRMGLGEIEIHLHHDGDTEAGLREKLSRFTELLASRHDALPRDPQTGQPRWTFIHGNWALDNCHPSGRHCGVDNELIVLREEGCYADFTLPAAPDPCQTSTVNRIYYAKDDPHRGKSHDKGERVRVGGQHDAAATEADLMIIQGPLGFRWNSRKFGIIPRIENSDIRAVAPPSPDRIDAWVETGIHVEGRPEWIFVKIHTHGAEDCDMDTLLGKSMDQAYRYLESRYNDGKDWKLHYVSARETYNIIKAAEAGVDGDPGQYRDFVIPRPLYRAPAADAAH
ncbi:right-handed parallel beta-helix repeat-containing protein [Luteimonas sp. RIT-PG2_3]